MDHRYRWSRPSSAAHLEAGCTTCSCILENRQSILHGQALKESFVQRPISGLPMQWKRLMRRWCKIRPSCTSSRGSSSQEKAACRKPGKHQIERSPEHNSTFSVVHFRQTASREPWSSEFYKKVTGVIPTLI